ncbi:MAG: endonuclease/exonuclease/phosphatase family protein [Betaproteobacteria bacterium]|nr:endonuclease/exonuclease/phosphatase family protein [Betaproteobacteria bacterium]
MQLITWNIQWCRGCDGAVDPARIVRVCREMADFDVLCFQEVPRNYPELEGSRGEDQFAALAAELPGFTPIKGIAVDVLGANGARRQFGNAIFSRLAVLQIFRHLLPFPADPDLPGMQRVAVEAVLGAKSGPLRVTTTHLAYYSAIQRAAQVEGLRGLQAEAAGHAADAAHPHKEGGPFQTMPRPASAVLTADFNFRPEDPLYERLQAPLAAGVPAYSDAWRIAHPGQAHQATLGVYDKEQWPGEAFCCDFIFVTEDLAPWVEDVAVNGATDASDHQPVLLRLAD